MKIQRGFRLDEKIIKKLDEFCEKTGQSYNFVIEQCVSVGFPIISDSAFFDAIVNAGMTREEIGVVCSDAIREAITARRGKKK